MAEGFRLSRQFLLEFEGELRGFEVLMKSAPIGTFMGVRENGAEDGEYVQLLVDHVIEWNYDDADGKTVPIERDAILANLEVPVLKAIFQAWYKAATGVTAPLDLTSDSGEQSEEESIPMDVQ